MAQEQLTHEGAHSVGNEAAHDHSGHAHSDTVTVPVLGTVTVPGGIYTVIFGLLAALTLMEVAVAELLNTGDSDLLAGIKIALLAVTAIGKAALVVWFYMHLNRDSRLLLVILLLPLMMALLSVLFLMALPQGGGMGYLPG